MLTCKQHSANHEARIQWVQRDDTTFQLDNMERLERWQYYASSYVRVEPTEGIDRRQLTKSVLTRNIPSAAETSALEDGNPIPKALKFSEQLSLKLCVNTAKLLYPTNSESDYHVWQDKKMTRQNNTKISAAEERLRPASDHRASGFEGKFVMNNTWMKGKDHDQVAEATQNFKKWVDTGVLSSPWGVYKSYTG